VTKNFTGKNYFVIIQDPFAKNATKPAKAAVIFANLSGFIF
jgi:hypothetical protein